MRRRTPASGSSRAVGPDRAGVVAERLGRGAEQRPSACLLVGVVHPFGAALGDRDVVRARPSTSTTRTGCGARWATFSGVGRVVIQPVSPSAVRSQNGCSTRERGRSWRSTVATVHQTIRWATSTKASRLSGHNHGCGSYAQPWLNIKPWTVRSRRRRPLARVAVRGLGAGRRAAAPARRRRVRRRAVRRRPRVPAPRRRPGDDRRARRAARRVTQQAVSKSVADLERRGYVSAGPTRTTPARAGSR